VTIKDKTVTVRDYGRGIPLGKVVDVVSKWILEENMIQKLSRNQLV
jgi:DNA gyrase/topoisomerase IV subunit B